MSTRVIEITNNEQLELLKQGEFVCLFIKANGCHHCAEAAPIVDDLSIKNPDIQFYKAEFNSFPELTQFYENYAEEEHKYEIERDEQGNPILSPEGQVKVKFYFTETGEPLMVKKVSIPTFLMFHEAERTDEDLYGFLGRINGNLPEKLEAVLTRFKQLLKDADEEE